MLQPSGFEYFYGQQAESYSFYRIPEVMFTEERFKSLSCEAKVLYGLMLDRMSLSTKNGWLDEEGKVYIVFPLIDIRELIKCSKQTAVNLVHELDTEQGIGLIEKSRPGLGKANVFYVKNFMSPIEEKRDSDNKNTKNKEEEPQKPDSTKKSKNWTSASPENRLQEVQKLDHQKSKKWTSGSPEIRPPEVQKLDHQKSKKWTSGGPENRLQEVQKLDPNKTEYNKTEKSETQSINPSGDTAVPGVFVPPAETDVIDGIRNYVRERIDYQSFQGEDEYSREEVDELVEMIVDVLRMPDTAVLRINGNEMPAVLVKEHYYRIRRDHIDYVRWTMRNNSKKVNNIRAYMLTALYNSVLTIGHYYQAEANYDVFGGGE